MLRDVLQAAQESRVLDNVVLLSQDPNVIALAREEDIPLLVPEEGAGTTAQLAMEACLQGGAETLVLLRGDLALLEAQDLAFLFGRVAGGSGVVLVPTPGRETLSVVLAKPVEELRGDFEEGGVPQWLQGAKERGLTPEVYGMPAGLRPTEPRDLLLVYKAARPSRGKALLKKWGLGPRLRNLEGERP
jgi:2-phospho-L-lactate guanylyltransferase (CobY/MobA/RfbA family)